MIISPPILTTRNEQETEAVWLDRVMASDENRVYPLSFVGSWHGGIHILHTDGTGNAEMVRAIADGTVVSLRKPSGDAKRDLAPLNINADTPDTKGSDDGYVLLKHETEIGSGENGKVVYYSLYMHLKTLKSTLKVGGNIYRKDGLGTSGMVDGVNAFHFQIFCDDNNISKLTGRNTRELDVTNNGRTDVVYGDIHFYLPAQTKFYDKAPANNSTSTNGLTELHTSTAPLYVSMTLDKGECRMITRQENAAVKGKFEFVGEALVNADGEDYEYNLYKTAMANYKASPSAGFELLRFGRVINTEHETLSPADAPLWMTVNFPGGRGVVNLAVDAIKKFSDADFPHWTGWQLVDDDVDTNSQCNSSIINKLRDDGLYNEQKGKLICKFPFEWNKATFDTRFSWLKSGNEEHEAMQETDYEKFKAHMEALSIDTGEFPSGRVWHFQPKEFIKHFRKCGWIDKSILKRIFAHGTNNRNRAIVESKVETFSVAINIVMNKYLMNSSLRGAHFLGQGAVESSHLRSMQEKSQYQLVDANGRPVGGGIVPDSLRDENTDLGHWYGAIVSEYDGYFSGVKYNSRGGVIAGTYDWKLGNCDTEDAQKFRGRGFKQLTGRSNYAEYWVYRAWIDTDSFDSSWWSDPLWRLHDRSRLTRIPANIEEPHRVTRTEYSCIDTGGFFIVKTADRRGVQSVITRAMELDREIIHLDNNPTDTTDEQTIRTVTNRINGGDNGLPDRIIFTRVAKKALI